MLILDDLWTFLLGFWTISGCQLGKLIPLGVANAINFSQGESGNLWRSKHKGYNE
jgi:hypothetical protein